MSGAEILDNGTRVLTAPRAAFGTDALLLGRFAQPRRAERALDMCSGCGIISLLWHDAGHRGPCTALELDPELPRGGWRELRQFETGLVFGSSQDNQGADLCHFTSEI